MLTKQALAELTKASRDNGGLTVKDNDRLIKKLSSWDSSTAVVIDFREIVKESKGFRIFLVNDDEFDRLPLLYPSIEVLKPGTHLLLKDFKGFGNESIKVGVMVSRWEEMDDSVEVSQVDLDLIANAHPKGGTGDRSKSVCVGFNQYEGCRVNEHVAQPDGMSGRGENKKQRFRLKGDNVVFLPLCEKFTNKLTKAIAVMTPLMDLTIHRLLEIVLDDKVDSVTGVCALKIITLDFYNSAHLDDGDFLMCQELQEKIDEVYASHLNDPPGTRTKLCADYLKRWREQIGKFCLPMTCGYVQVRVGCRTKANVHQYFSLNGLDVTVRFGSHTCHMMYPGVFAHQTPVSFVVEKEKVFYDNEKIHCFAWGAGGNNHN